MIRHILGALMLSLACPFVSSAEQADGTFISGLDGLSEYLAGDFEDATRLAELATQLADGDEILNSDMQAVARAFALIHQYDSKYQPLFLNKTTGDGIPRKSTKPVTAEMRLAMVMFDLQQALLDKAYTPRSLRLNREKFEGLSFATARYFPGEVPAGAVSSSWQHVQVNASHHKYDDIPDAYTKDPARRPTGCYLAPGSVAMIIVPASLCNQGFKIRVGAHSWDLSEKPVSKRLHRVSLLYPIEETEIVVANPLGGGIYMEVPYGSEGGIVDIKLKNVARSSFYSARSFSRTSLQEWKTVEQQREAPWADIESERVMFQVPSSWIRQLPDPESLIRDWDKAIDILSRLSGRPSIRPKTPLYAQVDVTFRGSAFFPGYPQSNYPYNPLAQSDHRKPHWIIRGPQYSIYQLFHEMGHAEHLTKFPGETEALVNLPYVAILNQGFGVDLDTAFARSLGTETISLDQAAIMWMVTENFRSGRPMHIGNTAGDEVKYQHRGFGKYVEIAHLFGWEALERFWKSVNDDFKRGVFYPRNADPVDGRILRMSRAAGVDLTPLIHFWGVQPQDAGQLATLIQSEGLKSSAKIYDRLVYYRGIVPLDAAQFAAHAKIIYPDGLKNPKSPLYGTGWYLEQLPRYDSTCGDRARAALDNIIKRYFSDGRPVE